MILRSVFTVLILFFVAVNGNNELPFENGPTTTGCDIGNMLRALLTPNQVETLQVQALRNNLFHILRDANTRHMETHHMNTADPALNNDGKRSISSLARSGAFPYNKKRSVEALARGGYLKTSRQENYNDLKRSIATLAKNGQLPNYSHPEENNDSDEGEHGEELDQETKRSIEAMARNGYLNPKREQLAEILDALAANSNDNTMEYEQDQQHKRNIGALARDYNFPTYGKRFLGSLARSGDLRTKKGDDYFNGSDDMNKRNIASIVRGGSSFGKRSFAALVRNNDLPYDFKRNIGSIVRGRYNSYVGKRDIEEDLEEMKRNLASIKSHMRSKRELLQDDYIDNEEYQDNNIPVYQNNLDYEEMMQALTASDFPPTPDKRFLGSVARSGWFRSPNSGSSSRYRSPDKRHIGSLARLGWLPAFRSVRSRFSRSGRSSYYDTPSIRTYTTNGASQINTTNKNGSSLGYFTYSSNPGTRSGFIAPIPSAKRYLLLPAVDSLLLKKMYGHPHVSKECLL